MAMCTSDNISTATEWPARHSCVTWGKEQKWEEFGINWKKGLVRGWGVDMASCYANLCPVEKKLLQQRKPLLLQSWTLAKTSRFVRKKKKWGQRERRHCTTDFFYLNLGRLFRACGGALVLKSCPFFSAWCYSDLQSQQQRRQKGASAEGHEAELASTNQSRTGWK